MTKIAKTILWVVIIVIVIGAIWYGLTRKPAEEKVIKIGAILSLTGKYGYWGQYNKKGIELAVEEINKQLKDKKLEVIYEDSQTDAATGLSAYRKLSDVNNIKIFVVAQGTIAKVLAPIAQKEKRVIFAISATTAGIPETGDFIFRNDINPEDEIDKLIEFVQNRNYNKVALMPINTEGGVQYAELFKEKFEKLDGKVVAYEKYEKGEKDFKTQLLKIKNTNPEVIYPISSPGDMALILKQANELGLKKQFISDFHIEGPELISGAGDLANGIVYTHSLNLKDNRPKLQEFINAFKEKYKEEPEYQAALAYDTIRILGMVINKCGDNEDCIKNDLLKIRNFEGITGMINITEIGDTQKLIILKTIKNGQFVPYEESD